jgi:CTP synthase
MFGNVYQDRIFQSVDADSIYKIPLILQEQGFDKRVAEYLTLDTKESDHSELNEFLTKLDNPTENINIAIVGKYVENHDSYLSIVEALKHASIANNIKVNYDLVNAREALDIEALKGYDGILVPGGFGVAGVDNKMEAIKVARENNIPFLGICYGMQLAALEFAKNVANLDVVHGENEEGNKLIDIMEDMKDKVLGGTMRLGNYECKLKEGTLAHELYGTDLINERHRHRYEFNNEYMKPLEEAGLVFSGINPETGLVEIIEYPKNDFFIAGQFHPELSSKLTTPNKLFVGFVNAATKK